MMYATTTVIERTKKPIGADIYSVFLTEIENSRTTPLKGYFCWNRKLKGANEARYKLLSRKVLYKQDRSPSTTVPS